MMWKLNDNISTIQVKPITYHFHQATCRWTFMCPCSGEARCWYNIANLAKITRLRSTAVWCNSGSEAVRSHRWLKHLNPTSFKRLFNASPSGTNEWANQRSFFRFIWRETDSSEAPESTLYSLVGFVLHWITFQTQRKRFSNRRLSCYLKTIINPKRNLSMYKEARNILSRLWTVRLIYIWL